MAITYGREWKDYDSANYLNFTLASILIASVIFVIIALLNGWFVEAFYGLAVIVVIGPICIYANSESKDESVGIKDNSLSRRKICRMLKKLPDDFSVFCENGEKADFVVIGRNIVFVILKVPPPERKRANRKDHLLFLREIEKRLEPEMKKILAITEEIKHKLEYFGQTENIIFVASQKRLFEKPLKSGFVFITDKCSIVPLIESFKRGNLVTRDNEIVKQYIEQLHRPA